MMMEAITDQMPQDLLDALDQGVLTGDQLQLLIQIEAHDLGIDVEEAVQRARQNTLPKNALGSDLQFLIMMLDQAQ